MFLVPVYNFKHYILVFWPFPKVKHYLKTLFTSNFYRMINLPEWSWRKFKPGSFESNLSVDSLQKSVLKIVTVGFPFISTFESQLLTPSQLFALSKHCPFFCS